MICAKKTDKVLKRLLTLAVSAVLAVSANLDDPGGSQVNSKTAILAVLMIVGLVRAPAFGQDLFPRSDHMIEARLLEPDSVFTPDGRSPLLDRLPSAALPDLETLAGLIRQDSLTSYLEMLQSFDGRFVNTPSNAASRVWLTNKLEEFGYDSILTDSFTTTLDNELKSVQNVIAYKIGTELPHHQIIVGAHRDSYPEESPGADDNGSGTVAVLEMARVLKDIDMRMTIIFALFDAEEQGMYGSQYYADRAHYAGDSIIFMLNMDMIGNYENTDSVRVFWGGDSTYAWLYRSLADSLEAIRINAGLIETSRSDHWPFKEYGYSHVYAFEALFSPVYHCAADSTTYISFDYLTRVARASLVTTYVSDATYEPQPQLLLSYPNGLPHHLYPAPPTTVEVNIEGYAGGVMAPGSAFLHYSIDGGAYESMPLVHVETDLYAATLPPLTCGERITYYFSAEEASIGTFYGGSASEPFMAGIATETSVVFEDDFETNQSWTYWTDALWGRHWERVIPEQGGMRGDPPTDYDNSGRCYVTGSGYFAPIHEGTTTLTSPAFGITDGDGLVDYARWYFNAMSYQTPDDTFRVYISNDNGETWALAETVGPVEQADGGWYEHSFWISDFVTPGAAMRLKFEASDLAEYTDIEAAVDAVRITQYDCSLPYLCGDTDGSWTDVNISDLTYLVAYFFQGGAPPVYMNAADVNSSGEVDISDLTHIVDYMFHSGPPLDCP